MSLSSSFSRDAKALRSGALSAALLAAAFAVLPPFARGDVVRLKDAGEIRGVITEKGRDRFDGRVVISTMTDGVVELSPDDVASLSQRPLKVEEYLTLKRRTADAVPDRWALAEWCREQGMVSRRKEQLEKILQLDPDHEPSHVALKHVKVDGAWMSRDEQMTQQGYVKHEGKFITRQEFDIVQKQEEQTKEVRAWLPKVKLWHTWLNGAKLERRETALRELKQLDDPAAIPALAKFLGKDPQPPMRELYIDALEQMPHASAIPALVSLVLFDESDPIWREALRTIPHDHASASYPIFQRGLRHQANVVVRRAAVGLGAIGDDSVIEPLIAALQTTHRYEVQVPDTSTPSYSFRADGGLGGGGSVLPPNVELMLRAGQLPQGVNVITPGRPRMKWITVEKVHDNAEVLEALTKLTGENFGYNAVAWKYWLSRQKSAGAAITPEKP
ncbi:MAG: HEAT repeat domain-containing protein [Planctomycetaceae bacterium]